MEYEEKDKEDYAEQDPGAGKAHGRGRARS